MHDRTTRRAATNTPERDALDDRLTVRQEGTTMSITLPGTRIPRVVPMTDAEYRAHKNLGRAEKRLVHLLMFEAPAPKIARAQKVVNKWTTAWREASAAARLTGGTVR